MPEVFQPLTEDVPVHVLRQLPIGIKMIKDHEWASLLKWLHAKLEDDPGCITATSPDDHQQARVNCLGSMSGFRPDAGTDSSAHKECALIIVTAFYREGLINLKLGKSRDTALLKCVGVANIEIASMLLQWGAGIPPWFLSGLLIRNLCPRGRACIVRPWLRWGGLVSERGREEERFGP